MRSGRSGARSATVRRRSYGAPRRSSVAFETDGHRRSHRPRARAQGAKRQRVHRGDPAAAAKAAAGALPDARHGHLARGHHRGHPRDRRRAARGAVRPGRSACLHRPQARRAPRPPAPDAGGQGPQRRAPARRRHLARERNGWSAHWPFTVAALLVIPVLVIQDGDYGQPWKTIGTGVGASTAVAGDAALSALETTRCSTVEGVYSAMTTMTTVR